MAKPEVSWYNANNTQQVTFWDVGQGEPVDAGSNSPDTTFLIWNNRGGSEQLSDMTDCAITTKDILGNDTGELVTDTWVQVRVDTMSESNFTAIGGTVTKAIKAGGSAPAGTIRGSANDGTTNSAENFAQVTLRAAPPSTATAGAVDFLVRVTYKYQ